MIAQLVYLNGIVTTPTAHPAQPLLGYVTLALFMLLCGFSIARAIYGARYQRMRDQRDNALTLLHGKPPVAHVTRGFWINEVAED